MSLPLRLVDLTPETPAIEPAGVSSGAKTNAQAVPSDLRRVTVQEFLRSSNLSPNSRKAYERALLRFLGWTELTWGESKLRHIAQ